LLDFTDSTLRSIVVENIVTFFSDAKLTFIITKEERQYIIDFSLDQLEASLNPEFFFRVSRSHIVNIHYIEDILQHESNRLLLKIKHLKKEEIFVSRERVGAFKVWLGQ
jgi:two-component system, LytTR family, response regulator LytT